jgi:hypothetical protein
MFSARNMAITSRFLGFVSEVIEFSPISRTLRVLVLTTAPPTPHAEDEFAAVFFAPGVAGVAIALWSPHLPSGAPLSKTLLRAPTVPSGKIQLLTSTERIRDALLVLRSALQAELRGTPQLALMLTAAFSGVAVDLAATATATTRMPLNGNLSLHDFLATYPIESTFPIERRSPAIERPVDVRAPDASYLPRPRQLQ